MITSRWLVLCVALFAQQGVIAQALVETFEASATRDYALDYLVYLPDGYDGGDAAYPLVLFLHGSGERGDDVEKVKAWGPPKHLEKGEGIWADFPAIVIAPQCPAGRRWDADELLALLDEVESMYRVDADRVSVTGLSMGGYGTWAVAERAADRLAAIVPICGGYPYASAAAPEAIGRLPVWAFHGDADRVVPVNETLEVCAFLKRAGGDVRWTIFEGVGHVSWPKAYEDPELWEWLFAQKRSARGR